MSPPGSFLIKRLSTPATPLSTLVYEDTFTIDTSPGAPAVTPADWQNLVGSKLTTGGLIWENIRSYGYYGGTVVLHRHTDGRVRMIFPENASLYDANHAVAVTTTYSNVAVEITDVSFQWYFGLLLRCTDANNYWSCGPNGTSSGWRIIKRQAGVDTLITTGVLVSGVNSSAGAVIRLEADGDRIALYINGVKTQEITDSFNNTAVKHGIAAGNYVGGAAGSSVGRPGDLWRLYV